MMRLLVQLLVLLSVLLFFSFIIGTTAVCFALVMLDNFVENQKSDIPRRCYEGLTVKQRFNILTLVTCKDNFSEEKAKELGLDNDDALMCIDAFNGALKHKIDDYDKRINSAIDSFNVRLDLITKKTLEALEELKKNQFLVIFKPLFQIVELCVQIIDKVLELMNSLIESVYQVFITLFMTATYGKNITAIILYVIAGVIIFIMVIIIAIFFALLPVPWFKIPALIYLAIVIGPLLVGKLVVMILKALSKLLLLKKIEEGRACNEYGKTDCVYNSSFKYCKWYKHPSDEGKSFCYNPRVEQPCHKFKDPGTCNGVSRCYWNRRDSECRHDMMWDATPPPPQSGGSRRSLKRERPPPSSGGDPLTAMNNRIVGDQKFDDDQDVPSIP